MYIYICTNIYIYVHIYIYAYPYIYTQVDRKTETETETETEAETETETETDRQTDREADRWTAWHGCRQTDIDRHKCEKHREDYIYLYSIILYCLHRTRYRRTFSYMHTMVLQRCSRALASLTSASIFLHQLPRDVPGWSEDEPHSLGTGHDTA